MNLSELAAEHLLGLLPPEDLPALACDALIAGHESPSLVELAGTGKHVHPADLRALFSKALEELGVPVRSRLDAAHVLKQKLARQVVEGELSPRDGAQRIVLLMRDIEKDLPRTQRIAGAEFGISGLLGSYYQLDDSWAQDPKHARQLEEDIVTSCRRIARGEDDRG